MKQKTKRLIAFLMAVIMLLGTGLTTSVFAADSEASGGGSDSLQQQNSLSFDLISYEDYKSKYDYVDEDDDEYVEPEYREYEVEDILDYFTGDVKTLLEEGEADEDEEAVVSEETYEGRECVIANGQTDLSWVVDIEEDGWYTVSVDYCSHIDENDNNISSNIERVFLIDGETMYDEARYIALPKTWRYIYQSDDRAEAFEKDGVGNEVKPEVEAVYEWDTYTVRDFYGYYTEDLMFYFTEGEHYITLQGVREWIAVSGIKVHTPEQLPTYKEYLAEQEALGHKKAAKADAIKLEAEMPAAVGDATMYPVYDRSSSITSPQHHSNIMLNTMGAEKWASSGKWIRYEFTCEASGMYDVVLRYRQDAVNGMYTSRALKVNDEYLFEEAKLLRFDFNSDWQTSGLTDGNNVFSIYFEKGKTYRLEFEVTLGNMSDIVRRVADIIDCLNEDYMAILQLTGNTPDENRDYGLGRIMPQTIADLGRQANNLYDTVDYISEMNGIKSDNTSTLEQAAVLVERMASDESEIAMNLTALKDWISSLGTWLTTACNQFVELDYVMIQPAGAEMPQAKDSAWEAVVYEFQKFLASFYADYNSMGSETGEGEKLVVWTSSGRDQAQIIKNLINEGFATQNNAAVELKLTAGGTLLPSILAGVGPDVSIDATSPMDMAIRGALVPLNDFDTYDEVMARFSDSAKIPLSIYGITYAVPVAQILPLMFARNDVLSQLDLEVPETWGELMSLVPVLQFNNMEIGMAQEYSFFLYQEGGSYWRNEGMATNLDSTLALDSFEYMCNMFTQYSLPVQFDSTNRFKTGEMPLFFGDYALYNTLTIFAPEISGLWNFYQIPGTMVEDEDGNEVLNRSGISYITGVIIPRGCANEELAWDFLDWFSAADFQVDYSNEMVALLGPSGKQAVANLEAFDRLPWTDTEREVLKTSLEASYAIEPYPGDYFILRYTGFAFNRAYSEGVDPSDELLSYISTINKEITRKREEFDLMTMAEWEAIAAYTGYESFAEWKVFWANEYLGLDATEDDLKLAGIRKEDGEVDNTYVKDVEGADFTYVDWMEENGIDAASHEKWAEETEDGATKLSYKEWLGKQ